MLQELYDAGARRYLLRIESSNPELYAALHPDAMSWQRRVDCLNSLKKIGYMVSCYFATCHFIVLLHVV
jgi:biotin synthase-like enzyme